MANSPLGTKDRPYRVRLSLVNGESSSDISQGDVVCFSSSDLGKVVLPATATAVLATNLFAGVAASDAAPGQPVEIVAGGYCYQAKYVNRSRAASTDSAAAVASVAAGAALTINTVYNGFESSSAGGAALALPAAVLLESIAAIVSITTASTNSSTVTTSMVKVWVRALG